MKMSRFTFILMLFGAGGFGFQTFSIASANAKKLDAGEQGLRAAPEAVKSRVLDELFEVIYLRLVKFEEIYNRGGRGIYEVEVGYGPVSRKNDLTIRLEIAADGELLHNFPWISEGSPSSVGFQSIVRTLPERAKRAENLDAGEKRLRAAPETVRSRLLDEILLEVKDLRLAKLEEVPGLDSRRIYKVEVLLEPDFTEKTELTIRLIIAADGELLDKKTTETRHTR